MKYKTPILPDETPAKKNLIKKTSRAIYLQFHNREEDEKGEMDPLLEREFSPAEGVIQRYENRALILVSSKCFAYCSFCNRRFFVREEKEGNEKTLKVNIENAIDYIRSRKKIREVLLSGGDPLTLKDEEILQIIEKLREIPSVSLIRIGTRAPTTNPSRITIPLVRSLTKFKPIIISVHFNHPDELYKESIDACQKFLNNGIMVLNQAVLLKGINDTPQIIAELCWKLAENGIRPYYLFQCDRVKGTARFWVPLKKGIEIAKEIRKMLPGHAIPHYVVDLPGKSGKAWIDPFNPPRKIRNGYILHGSSGKTYLYRDI